MGSDGNVYPSYDEARDVGEEFVRNETVAGNDVYLEAVSKAEHCAFVASPTLTSGTVCRGEVHYQMDEQAHITDRARSRAKCAT